MRILRLTALRSYLILSKNIKKSILAINIGIFLSIFAATAALISLYIERQISEQEFNLIEYQQYEKSQRAIIEKLPSMLAILDEALLSEKERNQFYDFIKFTKFGNKIISKNDLYLPYLYDFDDWEDFFGKDVIEMNKMLVEYVDLYIFDESTKKEYKNLIKKFSEYASKGDLITPEELQIIQKKLFHSSYSDLLKEIQEDQNNILYEGDLYVQSLKALELIKFIKKYILMMEDLFLGEIRSYSLLNLETNENIIKYSSYEIKLIVGAFILQLIIFCIIQFFEISAVTSHKIKNKVKK